MFASKEKSSWPVGNELQQTVDEALLYDLAFCCMIPFLCILEVTPFMGE